MMSLQDKKLRLTVRVESGCLDPNGVDVIDDFCRLEQKEFESFYANFIHWQIVPIHNVALPEVSYHIDNKKLDSAKATKYLTLF